MDFIFGNSIALLEHCHIQCKSAGLLIAQSMKSSQESTGCVFPSNAIILDTLFSQGSLARRYYLGSLDILSCGGLFCCN
ncbi:hypothetical protein DKX38_027062 [Salix brachista]|uniref:Uncharacterized protein n=1 Tax=Salix brachista TaxID=2182728 RepID=A0A5N5JEN7_9ROSI|nr:hypothetical protein DKX38_027062 [Salix brachista]